MLRSSCLTSGCIPRVLNMRGPDGEYDQEFLCAASKSSIISRCIEKAIPKISIIKQKMTTATSAALLNSAKAQQAEPTPIMTIPPKSAPLRTSAFERRLYSCSFILLPWECQMSNKLQVPLPYGRVCLKPMPAPTRPRQGARGPQTCGLRSHGSQSRPLPLRNGLLRFSFPAVVAGPCPG